MRKERIFVVARQPVRGWLETVLKEEHFEVHTSSDGYRAVLALFKPLKPDLVISDLTLHDGDGMNFLQAVKEAEPKLPVIVLTAGEDLTTVIEAMERGAYECIEKPVEIYQLLVAIAKLLKIDNLSLGLAEKSPQSDMTDFSQIVVGKSQAMLEVRRKMGLIASVRRNALIQGETGTGKRLICRSIHDFGVTRGHPFVAVDVPALPEPLLEKVLFGQSKETHSGQVKDRRGLFETAGAGTILLNEIADMSPNIQERLLRVLRDKEFKPVGGSAPVFVKARVLGSTGQDLRMLARTGMFSEELFQFIAVCSISVPPLRERREDIPKLVLHLLRKINAKFHRNVKRIPAEAIELLRNEEWPGNVKELETVLTHAILSAEAETLPLDYLSSNGASDNSQPADPARSDSIADIVEKIKCVLNETNWDIKEAAKRLSVSRQTLYARIRKYGILPS